MVLKGVMKKKSLGVHVAYVPLPQVLIPLRRLPDGIRPCGMYREKLLKALEAISGPHAHGYRFLCQKKCVTGKKNFLIMWGHYWKIGLKIWAGAARF